MWCCSLSLMFIYHYYVYTAHACLYVLVYDVRHSICHCELETTVHGGSAGISPIPQMTDHAESSRPSTQ